MGIGITFGIIVHLPCQGLNRFALLGSNGAGTTVFLTTQYLDEAEQLADQIAILHEGRIIANGTLAELRNQFPPTKVEYIEKQPTLEEIFLAIIGKKEEK